MYRVIIVEDEMLVRIGLKNSVDWNQFSMKVVADLPDGQAAWDYYLQEKPDLIITDIRMPRMDGMELINRIRKQDKATRIVVLSCLEEFELARKAVSLGVSDYILKLTMTEDEIAGVLQRVRSEMDALGMHMASQDDPALLTPANLELVKEKYIKDFLFYNIYSADEFDQFVAQSRLRLSPARMMVCIMEVDQYPQLRRKFKDEHGHLIKMTLLNILSEITSGCKRGEACYLDETHYILLLDYEDIVSERDIKQETRIILEKIQEIIRTYFNGSVSFGLSGIQSGYKALSKLYADASRALERKFLAGAGQLHTVGETINVSEVKSWLQKMQQVAPFLAMLSPMKQQEYDHSIEVFINSIYEDKKSVRVLLYQLVQWISTSLYDDNQNEKTLLFNITEQLELCDTLPEMLQHVLEYMNQISEHSRIILHMSGEITQAIHYIKRNYKENISLQQVADHVNLSFSYLSNLFKKELQITFIDYLNRYRIERAKELLIGTQLKSYDIAVQVGFSPEYTYFSKVFKKVTGLNPNEYRRQWMEISQGGS